MCSRSSSSFLLLVVALCAASCAEDARRASLDARQNAPTAPPADATSGDPTSGAGGDPCFDPEGAPLPCGDDADDAPPADDDQGTIDVEDDGAPSPDATGAVCRTDEFTAAASARVLLVVDRSASMLEEAPGFVGSKWTAASSALSLVAQRLATHELGLLLFPGPGVDQDVCGVGELAVPVGAAHDGEIVQVLDETEPAGGTPVTATLARARDVLSVVAADRPKIVVLATDGAPNCDASLDVATCTCVVAGCQDARNCLDDDGSTAAARALNDEGVPVFVVGLPGSEQFADVLDGLAEAGGTALAGARRHYAADSAAALSAAVEEAAGRASCRFDMDGPVTTVTTVTVAGQDVARDVQRTDGWDLVDADTIELFGAACDSAVDGATVRVDGCFTPPG